MGNGFYVIKEWDGSKVIAFVKLVAKNMYRVTDTTTLHSSEHNLNVLQSIVVRSAKQSEINI